MKLVNNWLNSIQKKCLPPRCVFCGRPGTADLDLCADCLAELPRNRHCCYRCGEHFPATTNGPQLCGRCLKRLPHFDETHAPFLHQGAVRHLIGELKFGRDYKHARLLGSLLAEHLAQSAQLPQLLLPVPLHPNRYRQRGFNQSIELARHLSRQLGVPIDYDSCIRNRDTAHQTELPAKQRRKNLRLAFSIAKPVNAEHVAIVDDVMTTGATAEALAQALKRQGVARVDVWVCARA